MLEGAMRARVDRLAPQKPVFQHPTLTVPTLPGLYWIGRSASSKAALCHPPSWSLSYFHVNIARSLGAAATACLALWVPQDQPSVSVASWITRSCLLRTEEKEAIALFSLSLSSAAVRPAARKSPVSPSIHSCSLHAPEQRRRGGGEERLQTAGSWAAPLLRSLRGVLWRVEEGRGTLQAGVQRESSWPLLSLSPPPAFNQEGVPKFTAPFFIVGGMRGPSSLSWALVAQALYMMRFMEGGLLRTWRNRVNLIGPILQMRKLRLRKVRWFPQITARKWVNWDLGAPGGLTLGLTPSAPAGFLLAGGGEGADSQLLIRSVLFCISTATSAWWTDTAVPISHFAKTSHRRLLACKSRRHSISR